jgi:urease gamma subunit
VIDIKVTVKGEPDTAPFTRIYQFNDQIDYNILSNSIKAIKEKLARKMRININEALYIYLEYFIDALRLRKRRHEIIVNASKILRPDQVMIGVPESLREIIFNIKIESNQRRRIIISEPISTTSYILAS